MGAGDLGTNTLTVISGGLSVVITGMDSGLPGPSDHLDRNPVGGLGVVDNGGFARVGFDESIEFDFTPNQALLLSSVVLEVGNTNNGSLDLYIDGTFFQNIGWNTGGGVLATHTFASTATGTQFDLWAPTPVVFALQSSVFEKCPNLQCSCF